MQSIRDIATEVEEEFAIFGDDWESKYEHLIDLGRSLAPMDPALKTPDRVIKGCQSTVWLDSKLHGGNVEFAADSDAIITKGMVALMVRVFSGHPPQEILAADLGFIDRIGLKEHLSPTRANGLVSMIGRMRADALLLADKQRTN